MAKKIDEIGRKISDVQAKIKKETEQSYKLNIWGLNDAIISNLIKIRLLEDLIQCA